MANTRSSQDSNNQSSPPSAKKAGTKRKADEGAAEETFKSKPVKQQKTLEESMPATNGKDSNEHTTADAKPEQNGGVAEESKETNGGAQEAAKDTEDTKKSDEKNALDQVKADDTDAGTTSKVCYTMFNKGLAAMANVSSRMTMIKRTSL